MNHIDKLKGFEARSDFFIGIDSDGCVFDVMDLKHAECFIPTIINHWNLQAVSRFARQAGEFVTLRSRWRGTNRFPVLVKILDLLADWDEPLERGFQAPQIDSLRNWIAEETRLGNPTLEAHVAETDDPVLRQALQWSRAANEAIAEMVHGVPPFPHCRECLEKAQGRADLAVVSTAPLHALQAEWNEHDVARYVREIFGQESGSKAEVLQHTACGKYDSDKILMIGDAPGDMRAAQSNGVLFYPIRPRNETASWQRFYEEGMERFFAGNFAGSYQQQLIEEFLAELPTKPPWNSRGNVVCE